MHLNTLLKQILELESRGDVSCLKRNAQLAGSFYSKAADEILTQFQAKLENTWARKENYICDQVSQFKFSG